MVTNDHMTVLLIHALAKALMIGTFDMKLSLRVRIWTSLYNEGLILLPVMDLHFHVQCNS